MVHRRRDTRGLRFEHTAQDEPPAGPHVGARTSPRARRAGRPGYSLRARRLPRQAALRARRSINRSASAVELRVGARREQRLRVVVDCERAVRAEHERCEREHARAAAVVEQRAAAHDVALEPIEAQRRRRMLARAEREPHVDADCRCGLRAHAARRQVRATVVRRSAVLALPARDRGATPRRAALRPSTRRARERCGQQVAQRLEIDVAGEHGTQRDVRPERGRARLRLEHGVVGGVLERDRFRSGQGRAAPRRAARPRPRARRVNCRRLTAPAVVTSSRDAARGSGCRCRRP